jgi:hypothetical protein
MNDEQLSEMYRSARLSRPEPVFGARLQTVRSPLSVLARRNGGIPIRQASLPTKMRHGADVDLRWRIVRGRETLAHPGSVRRSKALAMPACPESAPAHKYDHETWA